MEKATRFCHGKCPNTDTSGYYALCDFGSSDKKRSDRLLLFFCFLPDDCLASTLMGGLNGPRQTERSEEVDMQHTEN